MEFMRPIEIPTYVTQLYKKVGKVLGGFNNHKQLWIRKRASWIAVPAVNDFYEDANEKRFLQALLEQNYDEIIAIAWENLQNFPSTLVVPATAKAISEFNRKCGLFWFVLFAGEPDWLILCTRDEYVIVAGEPSFVAQVLGYAPEEGFTQLREFSESNWLSSVEKDRILHIVEQLQTVYPNVAPNTVVNL